jgi:energy-coupling factor transport system ATP-binding protein
MNLVEFEKSGTFKLSYGERERVALGALLASKPKILIFDEPTTGQDYKHKIDFIKLAQKLNKNHTIITISHDLEFLGAISNKILELDNEKITEKSQVNQKALQNNSTPLITEKIQRAQIKN